MVPKKIDFEFVLATLNGIVEMNRQENLQEIERQTSGTQPQASAPYFMLDFPYNKMVALNFLQYCLDNKSNFGLDMDLFRDQNDQEEIIQYVWNNLFVALSSHNPSPNSNYSENRQKYNAFLSRIQQNSETYTLETGNKQYVLPINHFEKVVFYHNYGIDTLPDNAKLQLQGKDFIDAGAYIGDTALMLNQYNPKKIYAFEPSSANFELMQKTLALNNTTNVVPVPLALGDCEVASNIFCWDNASFLSRGGSQKVEVTTIDAFSQRNRLEVGLIKMDIEGAEYSAIQGAKQTIQQQKPVLLISLYHRGQDFFEIPNLLHEWVPTYNFRFLNLHKLAPILEKVLLAYN